MSMFTFEMTYPDYCGDTMSLTVRTVAENKKSACPIILKRIKDIGEIDKFRLSNYYLKYNGNLLEAINNNVSISETTVPMGTTQHRVTFA